MIIILFPGLNGFSVSVSKLPFMKLNPRYTGGEIAFQIIEESCTLDVRKFWLLSVQDEIQEADSRHLLTGKLTENYWFSVLPRILDSFNLNDIKMLRTNKPIMSISDLVIEPVIEDLKLSIPNINAIPEICPISNSIPFDVPSDAG